MTNQKNQMKLKKSLIKELKKIFKQELKVNVKENNRIYDYKNWDSLGNFNILLSIEKKFKVNFDTKEFNQLNSFKDILEIVQKKIKK